MSVLENANAELAAVESLIQKHGGVQGLVRQFEKEGLGPIARSWIGNGQNHPITSDQIYRAFGYETLQQIGAKFGLAANEVATKLAQLLPQTVAKLSSRGATRGSSTSQARYPWTRR